MASRGASYHRIEIPLPLQGASARAEAGGQVIVASRYQVIPRSPAPVVVPPARGVIIRRAVSPTPAYGPSLRVVIYTRAAVRLLQPDAAGAFSGPRVVGASGKSYGGRPADQLGAGSKEWRIGVATWTFPMDEPPAKLIWEWGEWSAPERMASFRMTDILLPPPAPVGPRLLNVPGPGPAPEPERAYRERGGGILVSRVHLRDAPVRSGFLVLGLARKNGDGWDAVRWLDVSVERDGTASLEDVRPGTYRVRRAYQSGSDDEPAAPGPGRWLNQTVTVTVTAGKELALPPLQWLPARGR